MEVPATAPMLMLCMLKATESPNFPQSSSHKHKRPEHTNLMHGHSKIQEHVIGVEKCLCMENLNALLQMQCVTTVGKRDIMEKCEETVQDL